MTAGAAFALRLTAIWRPPGWAGNMRRNPPLCNLTTEVASALFRRLRDHDIVRRDDIERPAHLRVEQVRIDVIGAQMRHPVLERRTFGCDGGQVLLRAAQLLRDAQP